jgi:hypothetical protein
LLIENQQVEGSIPSALIKPCIHAGFRASYINPYNKSRNNLAAAASQFAVQATTSIR